MSYKAILSSPLGFAGMTLKFEEVEFPISLQGIPHYVGHPATKELLDLLGAEHTKGLYSGPDVGESFLAVPLNRNPREEGYTVDTAIDSVKDLRAIKVTRVA